MMYELTCPSCRHVRRFAFLRIGARSVCDQCHHAWLIRREHATRLTPAGSREPLPDRDPLTVVPPSTPPPPTRAVAPGLLNLGGLSDPPKGLGVPPQPTPLAAGALAVTPPPSHDAPPASPVASAAPASTAVPTSVASDVGRHAPPVHRMMEARLRQKRQRQRVAWLTLIVVVVLFGVIAGIYVGLNRQSPPPAPAPAAVILPPALLPLARVGPPEWKAVDQDAYDTHHSGPVGLAEYVMLRDGYEGDFILIGTAACSSFDLYDNARLTLLLLDRDNHIFARADIALGPMSGQQREIARQTIRLRLPGKLHQRMSRLDWDIQPGQAMRGGILLTPDTFTPQGAGLQTQLKLSLTNPRPRTIHRMTFHVRAQDDQNHTLAQWSGPWHGQLEPGQTLDLVLATPLDAQTPTVRQWLVEVAAETEASRPFTAASTEKTGDGDAPGSTPEADSKVTSGDASGGTSGGGGASGGGRR